MAKKRKSDVKTIYDVLEGGIPVKCACGMSATFKGKGETRSYITCSSCKHPIVLSSKLMSEAKIAYQDEIQRRHSLLSK